MSLANTVSRLVAQAGLASCREQPLEPVEVEPEREYAAPGEASDPPMNGAWPRAGLSRNI
jgi:hypothetical protein